MNGIEVLDRTGHRETKRATRRCRALRSLFFWICAGVLALAGGGDLHAQALIEGRVQVADREDGAPPRFLSQILAVASRAGGDSEPIAFRTWETEPEGWFRLSGSSGLYTLVFTAPAHYMRPRVLTNQYLRDGDMLDIRVEAAFDHAAFDDKEWDPAPARRYWQPFEARGTGVTAVGFKLATDGVDGAGPASQDVIVSIHERRGDDPGSWPRVGPEARVVGVDCGGPKSYWYSAGWSSGEVPTTPRGAYAVSLRPAADGGSFQAFWRAAVAPDRRVRRLGASDAAPAAVDREIWLALSSDGDGLLMPYSKRVHRQFHELTRLARSWSQTWVAAGRGLCSVVLYAAVSGTQPPLSRQRLAVRVREGGSAGPVVGIEKIAVGNGNYTGDASWGHFVVAFAPGEVPLEPGTTYALELESIESLETIGDFVNIKGQPSDGNVGFNPYRKCPPDDYPHGTAYYLSTEAVDFDLDLQIVEYEHAARRWEDAVRERELLAGAGASGDAGEKNGWRSFRLLETTAHGRAGESEGDHVLRLEATAPDAPLDGGWVERVRGLSPASTYRLRGRVRSTWAAAVDQGCRIGFDATGQTEDASAATIEWSLLPPVHGRFVEHRSRPIRPESDSISVWLRAFSGRVDERFPFRAEFDAFSLREVDAGVPNPDGPLRESDGATR